MMRPHQRLICAVVGIGIAATLSTKSNAEDARGEVPARGKLKIMAQESGLQEMKDSDLGKVSGDKEEIRRRVSGSEIENLAVTGQATTRSRAGPGGSSSQRTFLPRHPLSPFGRR